MCALAEVGFPIRADNGTHAALRSVLGRTCHFACLVQTQPCHSPSPNSAPPTLAPLPGRRPLIKPEKASLLWNLTLRNRWLRMWLWNQRPGSSPTLPTLELCDLE